MKQKSILIIILLLFLQNCGYAPIYSNVENLNYNLNILNIEGNDELNNLASFETKKYSTSSTNKTFNLNIKTFYNKIILTKNKKGEATNYLIVKRIEFKILNTKKKELFIFEEKTNATNMDNQFEFKKYEDTLKRNFIETKFKALMSKLSNI